MTRHSKATRLRLLYAIARRRQWLNWAVGWTAVAALSAALFLTPRTAYYPWDACVVGLLLLGVAAIYCIGATLSAPRAARFAARLARANEELDREIAEHRRTAETFHAGELRYQTLFESSSDAIMLRDAQLRLIRANMATLKLFRCGEKEMIDGMPLKFSPEYQPDGILSSVKAERMWEEAFRKGAHSFEWRYRRLDGSEFLANVSLVVVSIHGELLGQITVHDVTEQRQLEESLRASEQRYRLLAENASDIIWVMDFTGRFTYVSPWVHRLLGYTPEEMTRFSVDDILAPASRELARRKLEEIIAGAGTGRRVEGGALELEEVRKDGSHVWTEINYSGMYDDAGVLIAVQGVTRDVTARKRLEESLRAGELRYRALFDLSNDAVMLRAPDGQLLQANRAALVLYGATEEELKAGLPAGFSPEFQPDGSPSAVKARELWNEGMEKGTHSFEWVYRRKDGTEFLASVQLALIHIDGDFLGQMTVRDITEQRRLEESLRSSEQLYRLLVQNVDVGITLIDADYSIISINTAQCRMFGKNPESLRGKKCYREFEKRDAPCPNCPGARAMATGQPARIETTGIRDDGATFAARVSACPVITEDGRTTGFIELVEDVTEYRKAQEAVAKENAKTLQYAAQLSDTNRLLEHEIAEHRKAEAELSASQMRYKALFASSSDAIMLRTLDRRIIDANQAAVALFGCKDKEEFLSLTPADIYATHQPDGSLSSEKAPKLVENVVREGSQSFEWRYKRRDGTEFLANVLWTKIELEGEPVLLATVRDITEQRRLEEMLRASEERYRLLAENASDMIWAMDFDDHFIYVSPSSQRLLGYSPEELTRCGIQKVVAPDSLSTARRAVGDTIAAAREGRRTEVGTLEVEQYRKDGRRIWTEVTYSGMYDDDSSLIAIQGVTRDITDRKRMEEELLKAKEAAEAATQAKSQFLANMSHEIRNPMTAILGYADLLTDPRLDASSRSNYLAVVRRNGEHLLTLINDILDLSKIEAGKFTLDLQRCNVVAMVADVASVVRPRALQRGISFDVEYVDEIPETILADNARVRQALINLAGNAVKFTERGGVRIVVSFLPSWEGQPAVQIDVVDTGIGIQPDVLPRLFQPFNQGDISITKKFGGTGLGLAISRHIVQMLGGQLSVQSVWEKGSTFTLIVPTGSLDGVPMLRRPAEVECESPRGDLAATTKCLDGVRILLAEDGYDNRVLIQTFLQAAGATVTTAENGHDAVVKTEAARFDVILMDMNMPVMDGYTAVRVLRDHGYTMPILALTANAMSTDGPQCIAAGCNEHLTKPIQRASLIRTIAAFVGRETPENEAPTTMETAKPVVEGEPIVSLFINDPDMVGILDGFISRIGEQIDAMRHALAGDRFEELHRYAHRLKGAGGCYGYPALTDACKILEDAAKAQERTAAARAIDTIIALSRAITAGHEATVPTGRK